LVGISLASPSLLPLIVAILLSGIYRSQLPAAGLLARAALVVPFSATLALATLLSTGPEPAATLLAKSYLSALATLLFAATTPLPTWTAALRAWRAPAALISTLQFVYRYLFVLAEEAQTMSTAARARGGLRFTAAAGVIAVLFARSWQRAESVHRAMLARGYNAS
jgi:cobalt/nickel transport system permease protein